MNLILNTPEPMWRMRVLTVKEQAASTLIALHRAGVLHPDEGTALGPIDRNRIEHDRGVVLSLLGIIDEVLAHVPPDTVVRIRAGNDAVLTRPVSEVESETHLLCTRLTALHRRAEHLESEESHWRRLGQVATALSQRIRLQTGDLCFTGQLLFSRLAALPREETETLLGQLEAMCLTCERIETEHETSVFLVAELREKTRIEAWIRRHGRFMAPPGDGYPLRDLPVRADAAATRLKREQNDLRKEIETQTGEHLENLVLLREALFAEQERLTLLALACESEHITLFEGWIPESAVGETEARLREETGGVHMETAPAGPEDEPPCKLRNPAVLRPFEVVIQLFATPRYREWDPTPVVAYSFALFFGIMLSDAIYGLLLLILAYTLLPRLTEDRESDEFRMFQRMLSICAGCAIAGGLLTGTYLGDFLPRFFGVSELAISPGLRRLYGDPMLFIVVALLIGLAHVNFGHALMLIRGVRERKTHAVLGRAGLFHVQAAAIPWILRMLGVRIPGLGDTVYLWLLYLMAAGVLLVIVASLLEKGVLLGSVLWVFDLSGILGDVMSYARLAGVGLATYYLAYSFNMMASLIVNLLPEGIVRITLGSVIVLCVLVLGHLLNLILSSITCFVHSLRLCFVEFLFKFYEGGGKPYAPFRLRRREILPVRTGARATG
jgi:V/A-type H+/Na+-transporting ATPase subunit I